MKKFLVCLCVLVYLFIIFNCFFLYIYRAYLEGLCTSLYDTLRPLVIHMKHLETLAEQCSILKHEMIQEQVQNNCK